MSVVTCPKCWQLNPEATVACSRCQADLSDVKPSVTDIKPNTSIKKVTEPNSWADNRVRELERAEMKSRQKQKERQYLILGLLFCMVVVLIFTGPEAAKIVFDIIVRVVR